MYRKITQEKLLKHYKCFQAPMDIMYSLLGRDFSPEYYLVNPSNWWLAERKQQWNLLSYSKTD